MAVLLNIGSGTFSSSSNWAIVDPTSYLLGLDTSSQNISISPINSSGWTYSSNKIIQGMALRLSGRAVTPTGTITVALYRTTDSTSVTSVTANVSDLPYTGSVGLFQLGWCYFRFTSPVTLSATYSGGFYTYAARLNTSTANQVSCYISGANGWARALPTTTNASPAASDTLIITGEYSGAGVNDTYSILMDNTNTTTFGSLYLGSKGSLVYATASSTNYILRLGGTFSMNFGSTLQIGSSASPFPTGSTATLEMNAAYSMYSYGANIITHGKDVLQRAKLVNDVSAADTTSSTDISTGWSVGDQVVVSSTSGTYNQSDLITLSGVSGTTLTHNSYTFAHSGSTSSYSQADIANLSRNIIFKSVNNAQRTSLYISSYSNVSLYHTSFINMGSGTLVSTSAIYIPILTSGSVDIRYCVIMQNTAPASGYGYQFQSARSNSNILTYYNTFYNSGSTALSTAAGTPCSGWFNDGNMFIYGTGFQLVTGSLGSNCLVTGGSGHGFGGRFDTDVSDVDIYSNTGYGIYYRTQPLRVILSNFKIWRNGNHGVYVIGGFLANRDLILSFINSYFFYNNTNIGGLVEFKLSLTGCYFWGSNIGIDIGVTTGLVSVGETFYFNDCVFGRLPNNTYINFTTACIRGNVHNGVVFNNCEFNGTEYIGSIAYTSTNSIMGYVSLNHNNEIGSYKIFGRNGYLQSDSDNYFTGTMSLRMTSLSAVTAYKVHTPNIKVPVRAGNTCSVSVYIRKSTSNDNALYNGSQPRLMYVYNHLAGNMDETIGATAISVGSDNILTYTENFTNDIIWGKTNMTASNDLEYAPDNTLTADKIITNNGIAYTSALIYGTSNTFSIGDIYTFSLYAKKAEADIIDVILGNSSGLSTRAFVSVDLNTGSYITSGGLVSYTIDSVFNDWYRISVTKSISVGTNNRVGVVISKTGSSTGDGSSGLYIWGAQLVLSSSPTTYYANSNQWQNLSYTTPIIPYDSVLEFYVDSDGSVGWVNVDSWSTTTFNNTKGLEFSAAIGTYVESTYREPGGNYTFIT